MEHDLLGHLRLSHVKDEHALSRHERDVLQRQQRQQMDEQQFRDHRIQDEVKRARECYHMYGRMPKPRSYTKDSSDVYGLLWFGQGKLAEELEREAQQAPRTHGGREARRATARGSFGQENTDDDDDADGNGDNRLPKEQRHTSRGWSRGNHRPGRSAHGTRGDDERRKDDYDDEYEDEGNSDGSSEREAYSSDDDDANYQILRPLEAPPLSRQQLPHHPAVGGELTPMPADPREHRPLAPGSHTAVATPAPFPGMEYSRGEEESQTAPIAYPTSREYTDPLPAGRRERLAAVSAEVQRRAGAKFPGRRQGGGRLQPPWAEHYGAGGEAEGVTALPLYDVDGDVQNLELGHLAKTHGIPRGRHGIDAQQRYAREAQNLALSLQEERQRAVRKMQQERLKQALDHQLEDKQRRRSLAYQEELVTVFGPSMVDVLVETDRAKLSKEAHRQLLAEWKMQADEAQQRREAVKAYYSQSNADDEDDRGGPWAYRQRDSDRDAERKQTARAVWLAAWQEHQQRDAQLKKQLEEEVRERESREMRPAVANYADRLVLAEQQKRQAQQEYRAQLDTQRYDDTTRRRIELGRQYARDRNYT